MYCHYTLHIHKRLLKNDEDENLDTNQRLDKRYVYQIHLRDKVFFPWWWWWVNAQQQCVYSIISRYHFVLSLTIRSNTFGPTVFPIYRLGLIMKVGDLPKNIRMAKTILAQKYISTLLYFYCTFSFFWGVFHSHVDKGILHFMLMTADVRYCQVTQR